MQEQIAEEQKLFNRTAIIFCIALLFGSAMTVEHNEDAHLSNQLEKHGRITQGVVVKKEETSSGDGRDLCHITYRFQAAALNSSADSRLAAFEKRTMVSDSVFDHVSEGESVAVLYNPDMPETSMLTASIKSPRFPFWLVLAWWVGSVLIFGWSAREYLIQRQLRLRTRLNRRGCACRNGGRWRRE